MLRLAKFLKPYWKLTLLAPLLMVIEVLADLYQPVLMADIVDRGIFNRDLPYILHTSAVMIGVALVGMIGGVGCTIAASYAAQNFGADLRDRLFKKVQSFSFANLDSFTTSSLITRLTNDVTQVQTIVLMALRIMVRAPLMSLGGIVMAVSLNARLSLILLGAIPLLGICVYFVVKKGFRLFSLVQKKLDRVNSVMRENLAGVRVVKAFVRSDLEKKRFARVNDDLTATTVQASRLVALTMPAIGLVMNLSVVAILWFGGWQVEQGTMLVGQVIAFINYMLRILMSMMMVAFIFIGLSRAKASADRINEVLETKVDIMDPPNARQTRPTEGRVVFENVSFRYKGGQGVPVLQNISFTAEPGETVAILGGTGSGKSTLVSLIPRLYDPTEGRILIDGHDIRTLSLAALRDAVSMVPQDTVLFSGSIEENIRWGKEEALPEEVAEAAKMAQAHDFITSFPDGYRSHLDQRAVNLSGGQKQRVSIARALIKDAPILIFDDSTSAVDMATEAEIQRALRERSKRLTTFIIAQRISSVIDADKILVMDDGKIVAEGTHAELLKVSPIYQEIYRLQMGEEAS